MMIHCTLLVAMLRRAWSNLRDLTQQSSCYYNHTIETLKHVANHVTKQISRMYKVQHIQVRPAYVLNHHRVMTCVLPATHQDY
jgi:hypothetical protein